MKIRDRKKIVSEKQKRDMFYNEFLDMLIEHYFEETKQELLDGKRILYEVPKTVFL